MPLAFLVAFLNLLGLGIVYPLLPFQALAFGATPLAVTLLLSVDALVIFLAAPLWGVMSDRLGRRPVILLALSTAPPAYALLANADGFALLLAARAMAGLSNAVIPVLQAHLADRSAPERRVAALASLNAAYGLVFVVGPLIALVGLGPDGDDYASPAYAGAATAGLAVLFAFLIPGDRAQPAGCRRSGSARLRGPVLRRLFPSRCARPMAVVAILGFAFFCMDATIGLWAQQTLDWRADDLALIFAVGGSAAVLSQWFLVSPLCRRFGEAAIARVAICAFVLGLALLVLVPQAAMIALASLLMAAGMATALSCTQSLLSRSAPHGMQGRVMGLAQSTASVAGLLGPLWGGAVFVHFGPASPFVSSLILLLAALLILARAGEKRAYARSVPLQVKF